MVTCSFSVLLHASVNASFCTCRFCLLQGLNTETLLLSLREADFLMAFREYQQSHYSVIICRKVALQHNTQISLGLAVSGG